VGYHLELARFGASFKAYQAIFLIQEAPLGGKALNFHVVPVAAHVQLENENAPSFLA
jgi:hypothetical protein